MCYFVAIDSQFKSIIRMTTERPTFPSIYLAFATLVSQRSTCSRLRVGTVITSVDYRKVLAIGYNGNASGLPNCCDSDTPGNCGCLHSEDNAIINCDVSRDTKKYVFVTHLPCIMCAKRLINLGNVQRVTYITPYRSLDSLELFKQAGIEIVQQQ